MTMLNTRRRGPRRAAFTLIEILIAIVVLVLGITGIVALFPTAIDSGNRTVEDTYAATITQSVVDAISVGLRESRYTWVADSGAAVGRPWTYFVFNHDGVLDVPPGEPEDFESGRHPVPGGGDDLDRIWTRDYCVVLPQARVPDAENRDTKNEPFFVYPVPDLSENDERLSVEQRSPERLRRLGDALIDNLGEAFVKENAEGIPTAWYTRVYPLGRYRDDGSNNSRRGQIKALYRGEDDTDPMSTSPTTDEGIALDPYPTYSFCFAIKRARVDTHGAAGAGPDGVIDGQDPFSNSLYELRIMIFKNFDADAARELMGTGTEMVVPKTNSPIQTFITLIST